MITFERITARNLHLVAAFQPTPDADPWVQEVEEIAYGPGAAAAILDDEVIGWLIYDGETLIGMAIQQRAHRKRYFELLHTLCINYPERGKHGGQRVLEAVLAHVRAQSDFDHVSWLVHPQNEPMNTISQRVTSDAPQIDGRGNYLYTWP